MPADGMAVDHDALAVKLPQEQTGCSHLLDDGGDAHRRAEIVADHRDTHAVRVRALGHLVEHRGVERAPPAAVNEHGERGVGAAGGKQVDGLARRGTVADTQFGAERGRTIGRSLALPAREDLRMLGNAAAIVVFNFVVDDHAGFPHQYGRHLVAGGRDTQAMAAARLPVSGKPRYV